MANGALDDQDWDKHVFVRLPDITEGGPVDQPIRVNSAVDEPVSRRKKNKSIWMQVAFYGLIGVALAEVTYIGKFGLDPYRQQSSAPNADNIAKTEPDLKNSKSSSFRLQQTTSVDHQTPIEVPKRNQQTRKRQVFQDPAIGEKFRDALLADQPFRTQQNQSSESKESKNVASQPDRVYR